jgi:putative chitinase
MTPELKAAAERWGINTPLRMAHWLAQLEHESGGFKRLEENLNYSAEGLTKTWPSRFPDLSAAQAYHRRPEAIANRVYSARMGNGDEASGDGWRYRGRGYIQLTGFDNYERASLALFGDDRLSERPEMVAEPATAADVAGWFWSENRCNEYADRDDINGVSGIVNRGNPKKKAHGLEDRMAKLEKWKRQLGA